MKHSLLLTIPSIALIGSCGITISACEPKKPVITYKSLEVVSFQPFYSTQDPTPVAGWELPEGFEHYADLVKGAGDYLKDNIDTITYKEEDCSKEQYLQASLLSKMGKDQIIMFEGHGSFTPLGGGGDPNFYSVMWTGRTWGATPVVQEDLDELRLINAEGNEAISLYFIEHYVGDLDGSIVYLGNCFSGREVTFAQAFLKKGAEAVIGNSDTIQVAYNSLIEYTTIKKLGDINPKTHLPYTLYEALTYAKSVYGQTDAEKYPYAAGAEPILFGNPNFRICKN